MRESTVPLFCRHLYEGLPGPFNMVSDMSDVTRGTGTHSCHKK